MSKEWLLEYLTSGWCKPFPPGYGMGAGLLKDGEGDISATNCNFKGRTGSPSAFAYLASPAVVKEALCFSGYNFGTGSNRE